MKTENPANSKRYKCPFCKQNAIFIGVHDDEGNYHGELGCDYESDPWSGLSYALHHDGWGACILCTDGSNEVMGGVLFDTPQDAANALILGEAHADNNEAKSIF